MCIHHVQPLEKVFSKASTGSAKTSRANRLTTPGEQKHVINNSGKKKQHSSEHNYNNNKKRDISSGYEKMKNPTKQQKKIYIDPSHKIPLTIISSYKTRESPPSPLSLSFRFFAFSSPSSMSAFPWILCSYF